jgi:1-acyl-sn-glycerol-3-phosphate acyltransferase
MKSYDYSRIRDYKTYNILFPVAKFVVRVAYKIKMVGKDNIPSEGGFILACNHVTAFDPVILATGKK